MLHSGTPVPEPGRSNLGIEVQLDLRRTTLASDEERFVGAAGDDHEDKLESPPMEFLARSVRICVKFITYYWLHVAVTVNISWDDHMKHWIM
jgi:hypothetical protein